MWNAEAITKAVLAVVIPLLTMIGFGSRRMRLRNEIRENLTLVDEIDKHELLRDHTPARIWLQGRIALDVAKISGQNLGTPKAPIQKGSVAFAAVLLLAFGTWTYVLNRDGFVWYSVFPGIVATAMLLSIFGLLMNRELPPEETGDLPPGAVLAPTESASEQVTTKIAIAATGGVDERWETGGQVAIVFEFLSLLQSGSYEHALSLADDDWILCRVQAWLWNNRTHFGDDPTELERIAVKMLSDRENSEAWQEFVASETHQFIETWGPLGVREYGAGNRRRRLAKDVDLVILAPVGTKGGYYVMTATAVPDALTFVVRWKEGSWRILNHLGYAPPTPGWPPIWWAPNDPAIEALPEAN